MVPLEAFNAVTALADIDFCEKRCAYHSWKETIVLRWRYPAVLPEHRRIGDGRAELAELAPRGSRLRE